MNNSHNHKEISYGLKSNWAHSHPIHFLNNSHFHKEIIGSKNRYKHNNSLDCDKRNS